MPQQYDLAVLSEQTKVLFPFFVPPKTPKMGNFGCFWLFWEYQKWHFGCPNQNSKTTFPYNPHPPENLHLDTSGTILDPGKVIFGHFIFLVILPLKFPLKAKNFWGGPSN